jgi:hypothetical protein
VEPWPAAPLFPPELAPIYRGIEALEQFNRETRLLVLDRDLVERQSARHALAGDGCGVRYVGGGNGGPPTAAGRRVAVVAAS